MNIHGMLWIAENMENFFSVWQTALVALSHAVMFQSGGKAAMCKGLGIDICEIARMKKLLEDDRFLQRYFTKAEAAYVRSRGAGAAASLAGLFAAREALGKALGGGIDFDLREAEICHTETGAPYFTFSGNLKDRLINDRVFLSISHDGGIASAICFVESDPVHPEGV